MQCQMAALVLECGMLLWAVARQPLTQAALPLFIGMLVQLLPSFMARHDRHMLIDFACSCSSATRFAHGWGNSCMGSSPR